MPTSSPRKKIPTATSTVRLAFTAGHRPSCMPGHCRRSGASSTVSISSTPDSSGCRNGGPIPASRHRAACDRYAPASAARLRCSLPRTRQAARGRRVGGRYPELVPDGLLDLLLGWPGVHRDHVFLAAEDVEHGIGLVVVLAEPDGERLLGVILAPDQLAAAGVAPTVA